MTAAGTSGGRVGPPAADVHTEEIDGRLAVYAPRTQRILYLNETATRVLQLCDGTRTDRDVTAMLAAAYGQGVDVVEPEVRRLLRRLRAAGVLAATGREA
jgi:hypothetical protein